MRRTQPFLVSAELRSRHDVANQVERPFVVSAAFTLETTDIRAKATTGFQGSTFLQRKCEGAAAIRNIQASRERVAASSAAAAPGIPAGHEPTTALRDT